MLAFTKLVINECIKIFKKKVTMVFLIALLLSLFVSYGVNLLQSKPNNIYDSDSVSKEWMNKYIDNWSKELKGASESKKIDLQAKIDIYKFAFQNNIRLHASDYSYKNDLISILLKETEKFNLIDKSIKSKEYENQKNKILEIRRIIEENDFNGYIEYNKNEINEKYKNKEIELDQYNDEIERQNQALKYELRKKTLGELSWTEKLVNRNIEINTILSGEYNFTEKEYLTEKNIKKLEDERVINKYKLDNDIPMFYNNIASNCTIDEYYGNFENSYYRYRYSNVAITISMFVITLLFIILSSSCISGEISKGTIKFLAISQFKRYKIILSKVFAITIVLIIVTVVLSQINVLLGNLFFGNASNEYVYAQNGVANIMNTNMYESLQFLLKLPEVVIYILLGITLSTVFRNTVISNTVTLITYLFSTFIMFLNSIASINEFSGVINQSLIKYLPIANFNLSSLLLPNYDRYSTTFYNASYLSNTVEFSLVVLCVTALLLLITMIESFNKKDI